MPRSSGSLDRKIIIERYSATMNDFNEEVRSWSTLATVRAERKDASDGEKYAANQVSAFLLSRFVIRYSAAVSSVNAKDRINHEGHYWNISGVKETQDGRYRFLEITAAREQD